MGRAVSKLRTSINNYEGHNIYNLSRPDVSIVSSQKEVVIYSHMPLHVLCPVSAQPIWKLWCNCIVNQATHLWTYFFQVELRSIIKFITEDRNGSIFICEWIFVMYGDATPLNAKLNTGINNSNCIKNSVKMTSAPWKASKGDYSGNYQKIDMVMKDRCFRCLWLLKIVICWNHLSWWPFMISWVYQRKFLLGSESVEST
jgi:hypothetical protein